MGAFSVPKEHPLHVMLGAESALQTDLKGLL